MSGALAPPDPPAARDPASRAARGLGEAAAWLFVLAVALSVYEVAARYGFNAPTTWIHATVTTMCAVAFALGGASVMARGEHIRIAFLPERVGPRARRLIEVASLLCGLVYLAGLGWGVWLDTAGSVWRFDFTGRWTPELTPGPPNWPLPTILKVSLLVGTALFALVAAAQLVRLLRPGEPR